MSQQFFMEELYRLDGIDEDLAVDWILSNFDDWFSSSYFVFADDVIFNIKLEKLSSLSILALLSITKHAEGQLTNRPRFVTMAEKVLSRQLSALEFEAVLRGRE